MSEEKVSRRKYIAIAGGVVAAAAIGGAAYYLSRPPAPTPTPTPKPTPTPTITPTPTPTPTPTISPSPPRPFEGETVTVCSYGDWLMWPLIKDGEKQPMLKEFEDRTGINVKFEFGMEDVIRDKITLDLTSHTARYDVIGIGCWVVPMFAVAGLVEDLGPYMKEKADPELFEGLDDLIESAVDVNSYEGKIYGMPLYTFSGGIPYRESVLEKAGVDPPDTFDDLNQAVEQIDDYIKSKNLDMYPIVERCKKGEEPTIESTGVSWAYGGEWFEGNAHTAKQIKDNKAKPTLNTPEFVAGYEEIVHLMQNYSCPGVSDYSWYEMAEDLIEGKAVMAIWASAGFWYCRAIAKQRDHDWWDDFGYTIGPLGPGGRRQQSYWTFTHLINADSKHKDAAWEVLQLLSSKQMCWAMAATGNTCIPLKSVLYDPQFPEVTGIPERYIKLIQKSLEPGIAQPEYMPKIPEYAEVCWELGTACSNAVAGTMTAKEALDIAQSKTYDIMKNAGYYD